MRRRAILGVVTFAIAAAIGIAPNAFAASSTPTPDANASVSVYWSYWTAPGSGQWVAATQGAGTTIPADGTSQGWRYGAGASPGLSQPPRTAPDFNTVCGATPATNGTKRLAVYLDFGSTAAAPSGQSTPGAQDSCAQVPISANGLQVLSAVSPTRSSPAGEVCGIGGYPAQGCAQQLSMATVTDPGTEATGSTQTASPTGGATPFILGGVVIIGLVAAAIVMARRRND